MIQARRWSQLILLLALIVLVTAGCRRKSSRKTTIVTGSDIYRTDNFPGSPADAHYTADDGRALSPTAGDSGDDLRVTFNGDRGVAMITYSVDSGGGDVTYAHYYGDGHFSPPIRIGAVDYDSDSETAADSPIIHAFFNTSEHASDDARSRDGDCLIVWRADDVDEGAATDDVNACLFVTYFDVSESENASARYGFQQFAARISAEDLGGEDVQAFGVLTDGLCGEARWGTSSNEYSYGEQTTSIVVVWVQREDNNGAAGFEDTALHAVRFDPAEPISEDLPLTPSADTRLTQAAFGASDAGTSSEETAVEESLLITYNNVVLFRAASDNATGGDDTTSFTGFGGAMDANDDITIQAIAFNLATTGISSAQSLHLVTPVSTDTIENHAFHLTLDGSTFTPASVYGSDEGLACLVVFTVQLVGDLDGQVDFGGELTSDASLVLSQLDEATGVVLGSTALDVEDVDITDHVDPSLVQTVISRNGDYIWAIWLETVDSTGADELALWGRQYQTTRIDNDGAFPVPDTLANTTSATFWMSGDLDGISVSWFQVQNCVGYICGAQSDPDILNVFFEHSDGTTDQVNVVRLVADVDTDPAGCVPTVTLSPFETFENGDQHGSGSINTENHLFAGTDSGEGGNVFAAYRDDVDGTATDDHRMFAERTGLGAGALEIDSAVSFREAFDEDILLICTPPGDNIGEFDPVDDNDDPDRAHGNEIIHVIFEEDEYTENDGSDEGAFRTRAFYTGDTDSAFGDSFSPNAGTLFEEPFTLELPFEASSDGEDLTFEILGHGVNGTTVGVWMSNSDHIYYQQFEASDPDSIGWHTEGDDNDVSDPFLVDDNTDTDMEDVEGLFVPGCGCNSLDYAMVFWMTYTDDDHDNARYRVRVLDGN
ncbi:MAG: hypothetical protein HUU15_11235 [Candidatus Brocadiae bacterium]|nr:hypothetical protein [Candidatus Brocadiia bacterium]